MEHERLFRLAAQRGEKRQRSLINACIRSSEGSFAIDVAASVLGDLDRPVKGTASAIIQPDEILRIRRAALAGG